MWAGEADQRASKHRSSRGPTWYHLHDVLGGSQDAGTARTMEPAFVSSVPTLGRVPASTCQCG